MTNKKEAWRLEDESGKKVGKEPNEAAIKMFFEGKEIGTMQSITFTNGSTIQGPYTIGGDLPSGTAIRGQRYHQFQQECLGSWGDAEVDSPAPVRTRTVEMQLPNIQDLMYEEHIRYQRTIGDRPEYLSLNKAAYQSFFITTRSMGMPTRNMNEDTFAGIDVILNPLQEENVLALGGPRREMQRSLYDEQS